MREYSKLICERKGKNGEILWIIFNDEKIMNALSNTMQVEIVEVLNEIAFDNSIRCVVLAGAGEKAFSSGGDIVHFQSLNNAQLSYDYCYDRGNRIQNTITYMEKPVIAAVTGYCFAGGMEIALCCDFIYASENSKFGLLEINLGILAGWGGTFRLPRKISANRAKEMIYRGEIISAAEALQLGLVNKVLPNKMELFKEVEKITEEMMAKPPLALRAAKNVVNNSITCGSVEAAQAVERGAIMWLWNTQDMKEGVASFVEKRKPQFKGI